MTNVLVSNSKYQLCLENGFYVVYQMYPFSKQEIARASKMFEKVTKFFSNYEISKAKSTIHAIRYVNGKYK